MFEKERIIPRKALYFLLGFLFLFIVILILLASYFSPTKEIAPDQNQERQQNIAKGITEKDLSFEQLPSIDSVSESSPTTDFLYTKEYQLSRLEGKYKLAELETVLAKLGDEFTVTKSVGKVDGDSTLVTFRSTNYELTYSLTKGLVGVGYKGSVKLDQLVPKLFGGKQVQELESKGYTKEERTKTGYHYFAHPKFQLN
jgi:hypothetical protein